MKIYKDYYLRDFNFWSGAKDNVKYLTKDDFTVVELELEEMYPDGIEETDLNDLFRFDMDEVSKILGYDDFDDLKKTITIFTHFAYKVYAIKCDKKMFELLNDINFTIDDITVYSNGDVHICTSYKTNKTNTAKAEKLIRKAFDNGLTVLDVFGEKITRDDFLKLMEGCR